MGERFERAKRFLRACDAQNVEHINGDLLSHLSGTAALLRAWGATPELVVAGICHAAYGTDGFPPALLGLDERARLREVVGDGAEATIYFYAACDRTFSYARIGRSDRPQFRDRFTGAMLEPTDAELRSFCELTFANELELASTGEAFHRSTRDFFLELFPRCRRYVSAPAYAEFERVFPVD